MELEKCYCGSSSFFKVELIEMEANTLVVEKKIEKFNHNGFVIPGLICIKCGRIKSALLALTGLSSLDKELQQGIAANDCIKNYNLNISFIEYLRHHAVDIREMINDFKFKKTSASKPTFAPEAVKEEIKDVKAGSGSRKTIKAPKDTKPKTSKAPKVNKKSKSQ